MKEFLDKKTINNIKLEKGFDLEDKEYNTIYLKKNNDIVTSVWYLSNNFANIRNESEIENIISKNDYNEIRKVFKETLINIVINKKEVKTNIDYIRNVLEFKQLLEANELYNLYLEEIEREKRISEIDVNTLTPVKFIEHFDESMGISFLELAEKVDQNILKKLKECGLDSYKAPNDCFTGWGIPNNRKIYLKLRENGIEIK